jgi:hypothetical protein
MKVQKAVNNGIYNTVASVTALNNAKNQGYSVTDKNAFSNRLNCSIPPKTN